METVLALLREGLTGGILGVLRIALIMVPVLVLIEIARHYKIVEVLSARVESALRFLSLPKEAAFPLVVGMFIGIVLGAALIIDYARQGFLKKRDLLLLCIFLCINHSVIEDALIFTVFGANPLILICSRLVLAVLITRLAAFFIDLFSARRAAKPSAGG